MLFINLLISFLNLTLDNWTFYIYLFVLWIGVLPEALQYDCGKCNQKQRDGAKKIIRHLFNNEPESFAALEKKFDPSGIYRKKYEAELKHE